jgi:hypothetical protein
LPYSLSGAQVPRLKAACHVACRKVADQVLRDSRVAPRPALRSYGREHGSCRPLDGQEQGAAGWPSTYWKSDPVPAFVGATRNGPVPQSDSWPGRAPLALGPSANRKAIKLAKYILLLRRKSTEFSILTRNERSLVFPCSRASRCKLPASLLTPGQRNGRPRGEIQVPVLSRIHQQLTGYFPLFNVRRYQCEHCLVWYNVMEIIRSVSR